MFVEIVAVPLDSGGSSLSEYVAAGHKEFEKLGFQYQLTPMSTIFECNNTEEIRLVVDTFLRAIEKLGSKRISVRLSIDYRSDKPSRHLKDKVVSVEKRIGKME